jgi:hypothetical protein
MKIMSRSVDLQDQAPKIARNDRAPASRVQLESDGAWCPMAHANCFNDSFNDIAPMRTVQTFQSIPDPPFGYLNLGAFTGESFAVCAFAGPARPALAAFDYSGTTRWMSRLEDLPPVGRLRRVAGILMAKVTPAGQPAALRVFAANPNEFIAYGEDGSVIWRRPARDMVGGSAEGPGTLRSFSYTPDGALVICTRLGWVIKLSPVDGAPIASYHLLTSAPFRGKLHRGYLSVMLSSVVIGNILYAVTTFEPEVPASIPSEEAPVYLVRVDLAAPAGGGKAGKIVPLYEPRTVTDLAPDRLEIGVNGLRRFGGSPCGMLGPDGNPIIIANAQTVHDGKYCPVIVAAMDKAGTLIQSWRSSLSSVAGEVIPAAPALYGAGGIYLAPTASGLHFMRNVGDSGKPPPVTKIATAQLVTAEVRQRAKSIVLTSPVSLALDRDRDELVGYTNVHARLAQDGPDYAFMAAFAVPLAAGQAPYPIWCEPLLRTPLGAPVPGTGTFGQASLFRQGAEAGAKTGLITTVYNRGTVIFR